MTYELLKRKEKRIMERSGTPGSSVTLIESKLLSMLQSDYLSLVAAFQLVTKIIGTSIINLNYKTHFQVGLIFQVAIIQVPMTILLKMVIFV